jgi:hypothetical protein
MAGIGRMGVLLLGDLGDMVSMSTIYPMRVHDAYA